MISIPWVAPSGYLACEDDQTQEGAMEDHALKNLDTALGLAKRHTAKAEGEIAAGYNAIIVEHAGTEAVPNQAEQPQEQADLTLGL